jgi:hypothetical protein
MEAKSRIVASRCAIVSTVRAPNYLLNALYSSSSVALSTSAEDSSKSMTLASSNIARAIVRSYLSPELRLAPPSLTSASSPPSFFTLLAIPTYSSAYHISASLSSSALSPPFG